MVADPKCNCEIDRESDKLDVVLENRIVSAHIFLYFGDEIRLIEYSAVTHLWFKMTAFQTNSEEIYFLC